MALCADTAEGDAADSSDLWQSGDQEHLETLCQKSGALPVGDAEEAISANVFCLLCSGTGSCLERKCRIISNGSDPFFSVFFFVASVCLCFTLSPAAKS